jgi:hypothetical protein
MGFGGTVSESEVVGPGTLVEHSVWGRGKVVEATPSHVVVHFPSLAGSEQGPRRKLQTAAEQLSVAAVQSDPDLDGVRVGPVRVKRPKDGAGGATRVKHSALPLEHAVARFRRDYPGLFEDPKLVADELGYKRKAQARFAELLGEGRGRELVRSGASSEITAGLVELYRATHIPSTFERAAACEGLKDGAAAARVLGAVLDFVDSPSSGTFEGLTAAIGGLPTPARGSRVLTWPNVTILPFLADPSRFMVLKPGVAQQMAARMGFDLRYSASTKWGCYEALLRMSARLRDELSALGAADYVDVQTFMWVTRGLE